MATCWLIDAGRVIEQSEKAMAKHPDRLVYSTHAGDQRKRTETHAGPATSLPPARQNLKIMRDRKSRKGKMVTVISGFVLTDSDLKTLAKTLKNLCGAGGTTKTEGQTQVIEIQGDHREKVAEQLKALGYKVKFAGG
ncbi:MAG: translation initiation factor [Chloroflexota bacterium]